MKVQVVCGFLGAGKTTLIRNLLKQAEASLAKSANGFQKVAVLVNEWGDIGIDLDVLTRDKLGAVEIIQLPGGCVCCSLRGELQAAVQEVYECIQPSLLYIEPSGIAAPSALLEGLVPLVEKQMITLAPVVGVVDATTFLEYVEGGELGPFFKDQVAVSDILLASKADLVTGEELRKVLNVLQGLNPGALVMPSIFGQIQLPEAETLVSLEKVQSKSQGLVHEHHFESYSFKNDRIFEPYEVEVLLRRVADGYYGTVLRAKGFLRGASEGEGFYFSYVAGSPAPLQAEGYPASETRAVFIGKELIYERLEALAGPTPLG